MLPGVVPRSADWQGLQRRLETQGLPGRLPVVTLPTGFRVDSLLVAMRHFARAYGKYGDTEEVGCFERLFFSDWGSWRNMVPNSMSCRSVVSL